MKLSLSSLFHRAQASLRKPEVTVEAHRPPALRDADIVAKAYRHYGPRVAREMVRCSRAKEPSSDGSHSLAMI